MLLKLDTGVDMDSKDILSLIIGFPPFCFFMWILEAGKWPLLLRLIMGTGAGFVVVSVIKSIL